MILEDINTDIVPTEPVEEIVNEKDYTRIDEMIRAMLSSNVPMTLQKAVYMLQKQILTCCPEENSTNEELVERLIDIDREMKLLIAEEMNA